MLVSHTYKFIYTKTPKTASTSVEAYFERYCCAEGTWQFSGSREAHDGPEGIVGFRGREARGSGASWWNHMPAEQIRNQLGPDLFLEYFKFTVVRDPFDKLISAYHYGKSTHTGDGDHSPASSCTGNLKEDFSAWVRRKIARVFFWRIERRI